MNNTLQQMHSDNIMRVPTKWAQNEINFNGIPYQKERKLATIIFAFICESIDKMDLLKSYSFSLQEFAKSTGFSNTSYLREKPSKKLFNDGSCETLFDNALEYMIMMGRWKGHHLRYTADDGEITTEEKYFSFIREKRTTENPRKGHPKRYALYLTNEFYDSINSLYIKANPKVLYLCSHDKSTNLAQLYTYIKSKRHWALQKGVNSTTAELDHMFRICELNYQIKDKNGKYKAHHRKNKYQLKKLLNKVQEFMYANNEMFNYEFIQNGNYKYQPVFHFSGNKDIYDIDNNQRKFYNTLYNKFSQDYIFNVILQNEKQPLTEKESILFNFDNKILEQWIFAKNDEGKPIDLEYKKQIFADSFNSVFKKDHRLNINDKWAGVLLESYFSGKEFHLQDMLQATRIKK
tara:strand:- start:10006 stop:11220 length:1215 start_codon:yes stop_codon:yes gene_type:complete